MLQSLRRTLLDLGRFWKIMIALGSDLLIAGLASVIALNLRMEAVIPLGWPQLSMTLVSICLFLPLFLYFSIYRSVFRFSGYRLLWNLWVIFIIYTSAYAILFAWMGVPAVPRSMGIMQPVLFFLGIFSSRAFAHYWLDAGLRAGGAERSVPVLIYGAGSAGRELAIVLSQTGRMRVAAYVDDDARLHGRLVDGAPVDAPACIEDLIERYAIRHIFLAIPSIGRKRRREIISQLLTFKIEVRALPSLEELPGEVVTLSDLRQIEVQDLLGRDPVPAQPSLMRKTIEGKTVLVTGAGGSIGSELCRQIIALQPKAVLLLDISEYNLYTIESELLQLKRSSLSVVPVIALLGDITDDQRIDSMMARWRPETVFHAAAYKHVPIVERNVAVGVRNNVFGTLNLAQAARRHGVHTFVLISSDKAVRPTNIMGASKRVAELIVQALADVARCEDASARPQTCFCAVRFGNVLGSSGSVVPLFRSQIERGGPITLTDERITRYFMTIREAAELVIQAGAMAQGGDVFVLDMGESVRIADLARKMVELSGRTVRDSDNPDGDIAIEVVGLRPGEKLYEELLIEGDPEATEHPRILRARENFVPWSALDAILRRLQQVANENDVQEVRRCFASLVDGYTSTDQRVDWIEGELGTT